MTCRVVVLRSGRGSNFRAIAEAQLPIEIVAVISNRPGAAGLDYARSCGIPAVALDHTGHCDREAFDALLADEIERHRPDLVVLAGYMRILSAAFIARFGGRLLNIHPTPNCGKGERGQVAHVRHGTAPARFRNVRVGLMK